MGLRTIDKLGTKYPERVATVDPVRARAFAAATNDDTPACSEGLYAPPVFGVVPTWEALTEVLADILPADALPMIVHSAQDMYFARPLLPGCRLVTRAQAFAIRPGRSGTRYTVRLDSLDADTGDNVLAQYVTVLIRGRTGGDGGGPDTPDHAFPPSARDRTVGQHAVVVDEDQTVRYSQASGDHNPIHLDDDLARSVGLPGRIVHGLCTMAMVGRSVIALAADGDPGRLRRLAVRFADVVLPGSELTTTAYDGGTTAGYRVYPFETHSDGRLVVSHGRAEIG